MNILKKASATAAATAFLMGAGVATASPATAAPTWINEGQVASIGNPQTARSVNTPLGTVQIRYGHYQGRQYGWGRVVNSSNGRKLRFEVDTDGDRVPNDRSIHYITGPGYGWTEGHVTFSSSLVAFRACILPSNKYNCSETTNRTSWW
ncbi:hypothetical protein [Nocardiopsis chromatogenes]|uniref:hypothetical protein n=1 Tax=Nocardiopsis chromatogenes TaxID=280239 RepID=UPI000346B36E|nr:hypothetical protein [Nocardiopsis chromatogenes]